MEDRSYKEEGGAQDGHKVNTVGADLYEVTLLPLSLRKDEN